MFEEIDMQLKHQIKAKIEDLAVRLMKTDEKAFCRAVFSECNWALMTIPFGDTTRQFVLLPSSKFARLIFGRRYLTAVGKYPELFGTGKVEDVLKALKAIDSAAFPPDYTIERFYDYLKEENMAYVVEITDGILGKIVLRLDLFRAIDHGDFRGGIFHSLKHFTIEDYESISKAQKGFPLAHWNMIPLHIVKNFFSGVHKSESTGRLFGITELSNGRYLVGGYFAKPEIDNLYYMNTLEPKSLKSLNAEERQVIGIHCDEDR